jgi:energy-coupling factor transporter transmembrane protein EcfT
MFSSKLEAKSVSNSIFEFNPLSKLFVLILFSLNLFLIRELIILFSIFLFVLLVFFIMRIELEEMKRLLYFVLIMQVLFIFINLYIYVYDHVNEPIFYTFPKEWPIVGGAFPIHREDLYYTVRSPLLIITIVIPSIIFIKKTDPRKLAASFTYQLKFSIRVSQSITIGLNFFPIIQEEISNVKASQLARGETIFISGEKKGIKKSLKAIVAFITTLLIIILRKIDNLSISLEKRGLGIYEKRTEERVKWRKKDTLLISLSLLLPIMIILYNLRIIEFHIPSLFSIFSRIGVIGWLSDNQWVFTIVFFSSISAMILTFILRFLKGRKNPTQEFESIKQTDINLDEKLEIAQKIFEDVREEYEFPITAGSLQKRIEKNIKK